MKKYISLFLILIIMIVSFCTPFEVNANPVIYPVAEGLMFLLGAGLTACGVTASVSTEDYVRKNSLSYLTSNYVNKVASLSVREKLLLSARNTIPGGPILVNDTTWEMLRDFAIYVKDQLVGDDPSITFDNVLPNGLTTDIYNTPDAKSPSFIDYPLEYQIIPFDESVKVYIDYASNEGTETYRTNEFYVRHYNGNPNQYQTVVHTVEYNRYTHEVVQDFPVTYNLLTSLNGVPLTGFKIDITPWKDFNGNVTTYRQFYPRFLYNNPSNGKLDVYPYVFPSNYQVYKVENIRTQSVTINPIVTDNVTLDETYDIPKTKVAGTEQRVLNIPANLVDYGKTVVAPADVIPVGDIAEIPTLPDTDKSWWETLIGGAVSGLSGAIGQVGTLVSGIPASIAQAFSPATTDIKAIADSVADIAEADMSDTIKRFKIPDLFVLSLKVIIATILMVGRAIVFVITIQAIPPSGSMIPNNMMVGLNYTKNYQLPIGISIWDLANVLIGFLFGLIIFKRVVSNVRR